MKTFLFLVVVGVVLANPLPEVTKEEEEKYLEDNLLAVPKIKSLVDKIIEKKKDEATQATVKDQKSHAKPHSILDPKMQDVAHKMADQMMKNPELHEVVKRMFNMKDPIKKAQKIKEFKDSLKHVIEAKKKKDAHAHGHAELNPKMKDAAKKFAQKMLDNPTLHDAIKTMFDEIKEDPSKREAKIDGLKQSIAHALRDIKQKKDAAAKKPKQALSQAQPQPQPKHHDELPQKMKDVAQKVAARMMDNTQIHAAVAKIVQMNDPVKKGKAMSHLRDSIRHAVEVAMKKKDASSEHEKASHLLTGIDKHALAKRVTTHILQNKKLKDIIQKKLAMKRDAAVKAHPKMKDMAAHFAARMMDNPKIHLAVSKIFQEIQDAPEKRDEKVAALKESIRKALKEVKKRRDSVQQKDAKKTETVDPKTRDMAKRVAAKMMDNPTIHNAVSNIVKEIRDHPEKKEEQMALLKNSVHQALEAAKKKRDSPKKEKTTAEMLKGIDQHALAKRVAHDILQHPKLKHFFEEKIAQKRDHQQLDLLNHLDHHELAKRIAHRILDNPQLKDAILAKMQKKKDDPMKKTEKDDLDELMEKDEDVPAMKAHAKNVKDAPKHEKKVKDAPKHQKKVKDAPKHEKKKDAPKHDILEEEREIEIDDVQPVKKDAPKKLDMDELLADLF